eukprot:gene7516-10239_t
MPPKKSIEVSKTQPKLFSFFKRADSTPSSAPIGNDFMFKKDDNILLNKSYSVPLAKSDDQFYSSSTPIMDSSHCMEVNLPTSNGKTDCDSMQCNVITTNETPLNDDTKNSPAKRLFGSTIKSSPSDLDDSPIIHTSRANKRLKKASNITKTIKEHDDWDVLSDDSPKGEHDEEFDEHDKGSIEDDDNDEKDAELFDSESDDDHNMKKSKGKTIKKVLSKPPINKRVSKPTSSTKMNVDKTNASNGNNKMWITPTNKNKPLTDNDNSTMKKSVLSSAVTFASGRTDVTEEDDSSAMIVNIPENNESGGTLNAGSHEHNFFDFLQPNKIKDKSLKRPDNPDYNPRTLFIPDNFLKSQTPAMAQWWAFKSDNYDTVLFFKVGKFYELFHMDADVGFSELDLIYMKGVKAHSGFPEINYGKCASALVAKGYRVARVEQTETPEMLKERNDAKKGKKDKVVIREMCSVMSKGTRTYCHLDDLSLLEQATGNDVLSRSVLCSIKELESAASSSSSQEEVVPEYGICCVDTIIGAITFAQFQDDSQRSRLRTMLAKFMPTEVLLARHHTSEEVIGVVNLICPKANLEWLHKDDMFSPRDTINKLHKGHYFNADSSTSDWPAILQAVLAGLDDESSSLVLNALGGVVFQLQRSLIDFEIFSLKKFFAYIPPDEENHLNNHSESSVTNVHTQAHVLARLFDESHVMVNHNEMEIESDEHSSSDSNDNNSTNYPKSMTLDEVALTNLEVLVNNFDRTEKGSLWSFINKCNTAFGKRLLRTWLCNPLFRVTDIEKRANAVEELMTSIPELSSKCRDYLKNLPDLERLLLRVHSNSLKNKGTDHPDSRAVMYDAIQYSKRKIRDFADVLSGFESIVKIGKLFENINVDSKLLKICVKSLSNNNIKGKLPLQKMSELLQYYRTIFDEKQAKQDGFIRPRQGIDQEYDKAKAKVMEIESDFEQYLKNVKKQTGINELKYFGSNKDRYQLEVPMHLVNKVPSSWRTKSQKKTHRRYWNDEIEGLLSQLIDAENKLDYAQNDTLRRIFEKFDAHRSLWSDAVACMALLDSLLSLALVSSLPGYVWPSLIHTTNHEKNDNNEEIVPLLKIKGGRHPMLEYTLAQRGDGEYIPNDILLGGVTPSITNENEYNPKLLLLSGPNMGGKSTLLRQTCLIAILAQIGCKVPADSVELTPVDRIFTRVGASDRILAGQSTFFVELAETATILLNATEHSLCILDELGRGTATFDGTAIAHSVVDYLVENVRCRGLFATHYHSLIDDWTIDPRVKLGHMDCYVENNDTSDKMEVENNIIEEVTFLYKLCDGCSPRSYGINVARLAGLPLEVITIALQQSRAFELQQQNNHLSNNDTNNGYFGDVTQFKNRLLGLYHQLSSIVRNSNNMSFDEYLHIVSELWRRTTNLNI